MLTDEKRSDIAASLKRALVRQGWIYGEKMNRIGNPFLWVDGNQMPLLSPFRGVQSVLQYLAMSGEIYDTPKAIRVSGCEQVETVIREELARIFHHLVPFMSAAELGFQTYIDSTASVKVQDYCALKSWIGTLPSRPQQLDIGPGLGANALYACHGLNASYIALEAHDVSYEVQRQFFPLIFPERGEYLDTVECENFELERAGIETELSRADKYNIRHVPSWNADLIKNSSVDLATVTWVLNEVTPAGIVWLLHHIGRTLKNGGYFYIRDSGKLKPQRHDLDYDAALLRIGFESVARLDIVNRVDMHGIPRLYKKVSDGPETFEELFETLFGRFAIVAHGGEYNQNGYV